LLPIVMIEIAARLIPNLVPPEIKSSIFQLDPPATALIPDPELGYKYAPNLVNYPAFATGSRYTYTISTVSLGYDEIGFRDDGINDEVFGVVIGDSFATCAGVQIEDCWVELLETQWQKDLVNLSVLGYSPQQEARMLRRYGLPLKPKMVLWVFFANDVKDAWRFNQFGSGAARHTNFWQNPVNRWLVQHSAVYATGSFFWYNRFFFYNLARADDKALPRNPNYSWWLANTDLSIPEMVQGLTLTQQTLLTAYQDTTTPQTQFVVVILPFREQVYASPPLQTQFDQLNNTLIQFLQQNNIPVLNLTPDLRNRANTALYFDEDIHLNIYGNRVVAELLYEKLRP